jgi:hypothetical protein
MARLEMDQRRLESDLGLQAVRTEREKQKTNLELEVHLDRQIRSERSQALKEMMIRERFRLETPAKPPTRTETALDPDQSSPAHSASRPVACDPETPPAPPPNPKSPSKFPAVSGRFSLRDPESLSERLRHIGAGLNPRAPFS